VIDLNSFLLGMLFLAGVMAIWGDIIESDKEGENDPA
jgi:hypothetical protein